MKPFRRLLNARDRVTLLFVSTSVIFLGWMLIPELVLSQGGHEHHEGMDHGGAAQPGQEYRLEDRPMEHMDHGDAGGDLFRTRGAHDSVEGLKKEMLGDGEGLLARGRNIYLHMCVF